jgi:hypothetical protein
MKRDLRTSQMNTNNDNGDGALTQHPQKNKSNTLMDIYHICKRMECAASNHQLTHVCLGFGRNCRVLLEVNACWIGEVNKNHSKVCPGEPQSASSRTQVTAKSAQVSLKSTQVGTKSTHVSPKSVPGRFKAAPSQHHVG